MSQINYLKMCRGNVNRTHFCSAIWPFLHFWANEKIYVIQVYVSLAVMLLQGTMYADMLRVKGCDPQKIVLRANHHHHHHHQTNHYTNIKRHEALTFYIESTIPYIKAKTNSWQEPMCWFQTYSNIGCLWKPNFIIMG